MDAYDTYARSPPPSRGSGRERDDYRSADPYRDRRRSPDRRRERGDRRRSRSPTQIDRYQPDRSGRDDHYRERRDDQPPRDRRRSSPQPPTIDRYVPGQDTQTPQSMLVNPMPDPMKLDFQVGFTWFAEWWRTEQRIKDEKERQRSGKPGSRLRGERESREDREAERPKIQAGYDAYKENLQKLQAQTFVRMHKAEDWFRERYVPEVKEPFRRSLMDYRKTLFTRWQTELEAGGFDDFTLEGIYKSESNGLGGILEKEEGETTAAAEVLGVGDLLPSKGGDLRDTMAQQPTLLIKTIAPTVTRERFVEFAKEHLSEGPGGYMHLSLSDPNPLKKCHRMGWIMLNSDSEQAMDTDEKTEPAADAGADVKEEDANGERNGEVATTFKAKNTAERALEKINAKTIEDPERGNFTVHCGVHRPPDAPRKKALWDLFSAPERIARDLDLATRLARKLDNELGDEFFGAAKIEERVMNLADQGYLQPPAVEAKPKAEADMDVDAGEIEEEGLIADDEDETDDAELLQKKKKLDLLVEYLRRVYNLCFFCVFESDSIHELQRKCPGGHLRRPRASLTSTAKEVAHASASGEEFPLRKNGSLKNSTDNSRGEGDDADMDIENGSPVEEKKAWAMKPNARNAQQLQRAFNWVKTFEEKILQWLEPENVALRKLGGTPLEEGLEEELIKFVKQEDASKYRCKVPECTKLFKGTDFWRKHVEKRHAEFYERVRSEVQLVNTYVIDPAHIAPSRSDANSNGHFPLNNHIPTGTPRGFQLSQQQFAMTGGFGMAPGMPAPMAQGMWTPGGSVSMPAGWVPQNGAFVHGGVGPMRSMGGRNTYTGLNVGFTAVPGKMGGLMPYARNDPRGQRIGAGVPPMGGRAMAMAGFGTAMEGGLPGSIGPQEAVAGRSIRSYEDLDADKGKVTTELDY
ncbi:hypothetical protein LTR78_004559 [Recurvomyces mirabilis]|uniref:C2H2-type domain-containing protein n=1 Tax=Recurvomyces mirabilis TaxID=574656 RepID=A0AAE0WPH2_9PEZI|nr:hypothetical protein LTR78_004559 [Recurvomyces mirabilis]KAK5152947.1 hypothetical protein LTS14_008055 [Recurvomyces mirabilis]